MAVRISTKVLFTVIISCIMLTSIIGYAQENQERTKAKANYELATRWSYDNIKNSIYDMRVRPNWLEGSERFWYKFKTSQGTNYYIVDPARRTKDHLFDNEDLASKLTVLTNKPYNAKHLDLKNLTFNRENSAIQMTVDSIQFRYEISSAVLTILDTVKKARKEKRWRNYSPDSTVVVFARNHNLFMMKADDPDSVEFQLTTDGEKWYSFASNPGDTTMEKRVRASASWFRDSKKFHTVRRDLRKVSDLWVINSLSKPRPKLELYKYQVPGEKYIEQHELFIFDVDKKNRVKIEADKWIDQSIGGNYMTGRGIYHGKSSDKIYFARRDRAWKKIDLCVGNTETGAVKVLIQEESEPYFNVMDMHFREVNDGDDLLWWSERDGWGHLYLYDKEGNLQNRVTSGAFHVAAISKIDTAARVLYLTINGKEDGIDPYYNLQYRVGFDGSGMTLLTPEHATHNMDMSESRKYFVDNFSRIDMVPEAALKDNSGRVLMELEKADVSRLIEAGWKMPETFIAKSDDGITDQYGVMWKPFDFDPEKKYPIITYVYPGPFSEAVPKTFSPENRNVALSQLGFIVVSFGNRGGAPWRGKYYHTYGYGNARDYGLADKKAVIEELAARHSFIDVRRVGIYGHSGGGFMSTAAMLVYPDFFKVAVSSAGNHDNNIYNIWWGEFHYGVKEKKVKKGKDIDEGEAETVFEAKFPTNWEIAKNLKGHLLLVTGDMDNNVHPANTIRVADALIKAEKRFDFMILPGKRHRFGNYSNYFVKMLWDYFAEHLIGDYRSGSDIYINDKKN